MSLRRFIRSTITKKSVAKDCGFKIMIDILLADSKLTVLINDFGNPGFVLHIYLKDIFNRLFCLFYRVFFLTTSLNLINSLKGKLTLSVEL